MLNRQNRLLALQALAAGCVILGMASNPARAQGAPGVQPQAPTAQTMVKSPAEAPLSPAPASAKLQPPVHVATPSKAAGASQTASKASSATRPTAAKSHNSPYQPNRFAGRAGRYYEGVWGVESLAVKWAESGELIRFSYKVLDPARAAALSDVKSEPALIAPAAGVKLVIPSMENIGRLRQTSAPEEGKSYWMAFSNKGRLVKRGDRVSVVIGQFHADGLVVD